MAFRTFVLAATALLVQMACGQQCGCPNGYGAQIVSVGGPGYGAGFNGGCGSNLGYNGANVISTGLNYGSANLGSFYPQDLEALAISAGSTYSPSGIVVNSDNLEIGGQLIISGQFPVVGTVVVSGEVPTSGQGQVQYNSAPGVGITSGGCGYGVASGVPNVGCGNSGLVGNSGQGFNNGLVGIGGGSLGYACGL